jgi:hypothetical protein
MMSVCLQSEVSNETEWLAKQDPQWVKNGRMWGACITGDAAEVISMSECCSMAIQIQLELVSGCK